MFLKGKNAMKNKFLVIIVAIFALSLAGCTTNPVTGQEQFALFYPSEAQQVQIGQQYAPEVEKQLGGQISSAQLQNYINSIGQKIARVSHQPQIDYAFRAVEDESVNALALPGGYIFITRGMLDTLETEDQLAGVLAHEITHVTAEHSAQMINQQMSMSFLLSLISTEKTPQVAVQVAQVAAQLTSLKYSRDYERQADDVGMDYLVKAGYSPYAMIDVMKKLQESSGQRPLEFFSTHPNPENRLELLQEQIYQNNYPSIPRTDGSSYKRYVISNL